VHFHLPKPLHDWREFAGEVGIIVIGVLTYPSDQNRGLAARLDELQRWLDSWRAGRPLKPTGPIAMPTSLVVRTTVWDSRDPETFSHMPLTEPDQMRLQGLTTRVRLRLRRITGNAVRFAKCAAAVGIRPVPDPEWPAPDREICRPILPPTGNHAGRIG
jgi:hypothetical protein